MVGAKPGKSKNPSDSDDGNFTLEIRYAGKFVNNGMSYEGGLTNIYDNVDPDKFSTRELWEIMKECGIKNCRGFYYTFSGKGVHEGILGLNSDSEILSMLPLIPSNRHIVVYIDHNVDVPDVIEEVYTQSLGTQYEEFFNDIPDECFSQVDENLVKTQGIVPYPTGNVPIVVDDDEEAAIPNESDDEVADSDESDEEVADGDGEASLHNVPIYEDSGDESDKEIYDEENDAAFEDNYWFQDNVEMPKVPVFVEKKRSKRRTLYLRKKRRKMMSLLYLKLTWKIICLRRIITQMDFLVLLTLMTRDIHKGLQSSMQILT